MNWHNPEKTMICLEFDRDWTWSEFRAAFRNAQSLMETVKHRVHLLFDMRSSSTVSPDGMWVLKKLAAETVPLNMGMTIVISDEIRVRSFWQMFAAVDRTAARSLNLRSVSSLAEAYGMIHPAAYPQSGISPVGAGA